MSELPPIPPCDHDECPPTHCKVSCPACGAAWTDHPGIAGTCAENKRLRRLFTILQAQNETPDTIRAGDAVMVWDRQWCVWREGFVKRMIRPDMAEVWYIPLYSDSMVGIFELTSELRLVKKIDPKQ